MVIMSPRWARRFTPSRRRDRLILGGFKAHVGQAEMGTVCTQTGALDRVALLRLLAGVGALSVLIDIVLRIFSMFTI